MKLICDDGFTLLEVTRALAKGGFAISPVRSASGEHRIERLVTAEDRANGSVCERCGGPPHTKSGTAELCASCYMAEHYAAQGAAECVG